MFHTKESMNLLKKLINLSLSAGFTLYFIKSALLNFPSLIPTINGAYLGDGNLGDSLKILYLS